MSSINLSKSKAVQLPYLNSSQFESLQGKGWGFSYVYHFIELKDVFLALRDSGFSNLKEFTKKCISLGVTSIKTSWNERRVLEQLNALKNFGLVNSEYQVVSGTSFQESFIRKPISKLDLEVFNKIYFTYHRFKEIHSWFIDPDVTNRENLIYNIDEDFLKKNSMPIFSFSRNSRFTDSFIYKLEPNATIYFIAKNEENNDEDLMRFWDVYIKWGVELKLLQKFNLQTVGYSLVNYSNSICNYFITNQKLELNLKEFISANFKGKYIYIPELIYKIAIQYRISIQEAKDEFLSEYEKNKFHYSLERTSEIFIRRKKIREEDVILHPVYKNSYISHLTVLK